jgi:hypothetical protein
MQSRFFSIRISAAELLQLHASGGLEQDFPLGLHHSMKISLQCIEAERFSMEHNSTQLLIQLPREIIAQWISQTQTLGVRYVLKKEQEKAFEFILERDVQSGSSEKKKLPEHAYLPLTY